MGNTSSGSDRCKSDHQSCAIVCTMTNSAPELGSANALDALSTANCIRTTCQDRYDICKANNYISAKSGVSAGDNCHKTSFDGTREYSDIAKAYMGTVLMPNGDKYRAGKLVSFVSSSGERHRVITNADRCG